MRGCAEAAVWPGRPALASAWLDTSRIPVEDEGSRQKARKIGSKMSPLPLASVPAAPALFSHGSAHKSATQPPCAATTGVTVGSSGGAATGSPKGPTAAGGV
jgi:hypothetical protein